MHVIIHNVLVHAVFNYKIFLTMIAVSSVNVIHMFMLSSLPSVVVTHTNPPSLFTHLLSPPQLSTRSWHSSRSEIKYEQNRKDRLYSRIAKR